MEIFSNLSKSCEQNDSKREEGKIASINNISREFSIKGGTMKS
jgi:hypothetical protein